MASRATAAVEIQDLRKSFGKVVAVDGLDLRIEAGTAFGLLGPNGAGKTTLVRIVATLLEPDAGHATLRGLLSCLVDVDGQLFNQATSGPGTRSWGSLFGAPTRWKDAQLSVLMAQAKIKADSVTDVQAATKKMFAAIDAAQPEGIRYASVLLPDGETFVARLRVDNGVEDLIPGLPEFRELQERVEGARAEPASVQPLQVIGSYRLF